MANTLPLKTITISDTMPDLVARVADVVAYLNSVPVLPFAESANTANSALTANNATYAFGKSEAGLNVNTALTANAATYLNGQPDSYYTNASNLAAGTVPFLRLPVANSTVNGIITTAAQSFAGVKTFVDNPVISKSLPSIDFLHSGTAKTRLAQYAAGTIHLSHNLEWNGSAWVRDDTSAIGGLINVTGVGVSYYTAAAGANPASLATVFNITRTGQIKERGRSYAQGEYQSYTPTLTQSGTNPTMGNGGTGGGYVVIGRLCIGYASFTHGSTTTMGTGYLQLSLPITGAAWIGGGYMGGHTVISKAGVGFTLLKTWGLGTTIVGAVSGGDAITQTNPITWASGDYMIVHFMYEIA